MNQNHVQTWDTAYEVKAVILLSLGLGLVGLDRFMVFPMFPTIMRDLHLNYANLGEISGILSLTWGLSSMCLGRLSDVIGRRKVVVGSMLVFSLLVGISGIATGLGTLLFVRALMGFADGAYAPPSMIATLEASKPSRHGMNIGFQQMMMPLFGLAVAPILVTHLLQDNVSWRWIFLMVTPFGLIITLISYFVIRPPFKLATVEHTVVHDSAKHKWRDLFKYRNVIHNMFGMLCWIMSLTVTTAFLPNYLMDYLHLSLLKMGFIMSAIGFGATAGALLMPTASDWFGRKPVVIFSTLAALAALLVFIFSGSDTEVLFICLLLTSFFNFALISLTAGPVVAESVPNTLMAAASGLVICTGEWFGGGIAPIITGFVIQAYGIQHVLYLGVAALVAGFINSCFLIETAPRRLRKIKNNTNRSKV